MMAAFNGEMFVVKPRWSGDCFSVNIVRKLVNHQHGKLLIIYIMTQELALSGKKL
jgi:hypothetical protein